MKQLILLLSFLQGFNLSAQLTEITPTDLEGFNSFGFFIDINGDDMVISADLAELVPDVEGSLYHYTFDGTDWQLNQQILPELPEDENSTGFGSTSSIAGDWIVTTTTSTDFLGAIVFYRNENGSWVRHSKINGKILDNGFGWATAIDGQTAVVSAIVESNQAGEKTGAAYVYEYNDSSDIWEEVQILIPSELRENYFFGSDIYLKDDLLAVSARRDGENGFDSGAVYVFERDQDLWALTSKLLPDDNDEGDLIGYRVEGDGDRLIMSGFGANNNTGSTYIFRKGSEWMQEAKLEADDIEEGAWFGSSIAIEDNRAIVGARTQEGNGAVYVFENENGEWIQERKLEAPSITESRFGAGLDYENGRLVIGAPANDDFAGAAFSFNFEDTVSAKETITHSLAIYPNPTTNILQLNLLNHQVSELEVYNNLGIKVATYGSFSSSALDVSQLSAGSYTLRGKTDKTSIEIGSFIKI